MESHCGAGSHRRRLRCADLRISGPARHLRATSAELAWRVASRRARLNAPGKMTALAGLWRYDSRPDAASECTRILAAQALYGPDGEAHWSRDGVSLGRRLARLLPEDDFDRQPLIGAGGRFVLVADLRLDNRDELALL